MAESPFHPPDPPPAASPTSPPPQPLPLTDHEAPWDQIAPLYQLMTQEGLEELEWTEGVSHVHLKRAAKRPTTASLGVFDLPESTGTLHRLQSPLAGIFYLSSSPARPPFVQEGDTVAVGMTMCIVEAMKVMNEIKADQRCRVVKILIENGKPVHAGQPLFLLQPL